MTRGEIFKEGYAAMEILTELVNSTATLTDLLSRLEMPKDVIDDIMAQIFRNNDILSKAKGQCA